jgi:hypothetical protein
MSRRTTVYCQTCKRRVLWRTVDDETVVYVDHKACEHDECSGGLCCASGKTMTLSLLPGWHPFHVCGIYCDGQDGMSSDCAKDKRRGPPSAVDRLGNLVS